MACTTSTHLNETYTLVAANDVLLDSSVMKYSPTDFQRPELLNKNLIKGNILLCGYSFNFVVGIASIKKVSETTKALGAVALFSARGPNIKDFSFQEADLLKPDILAPGSLIWATWCPNGTDEPNYVGEGFAIISGTSMAAPHIAGIAALIKQKHPHWSPVAIKSALMTTSTTLHDILYLLDRAL
ncbi:hypothetical protein JHK85_035937 [Glycine max]|nr:hypothetical protein JHK85_035937 [Glycine max]